MANDTFKIEDYSKLIKKFERFTEAVQKKHAWGAARKGAQVVADQAKVNASKVDDPKTPMAIDKFIHVQRASKIAKANKSVAYRIGVRGGSVYENGKRITPTYWRFLELGTEDTRAQPFLVPAIRSSGPAAVKALAESLEKRIDKELKK